MKRLNNYIKIIVLVVVLSSCGARKVIRIESKEAAKAEFSDQSKSEQTEQSQTKGEINVKKSEEVTVDNQNQTLTKKETIEPVDPTKPASYTDKDGKKQELNNSKKTIETRTQINNTKTESKVKTETLEKKESKTNKKKYENKNIKAKTIEVLRYLFIKFIFKYKSNSFVKVTSINSKIKIHFLPQIRKL